MVTIRMPWKRHTVGGAGECLAMVPYFRLKGLRAMPRFFWNAVRVERQLGRSEGLICRSSGAKPCSFEFWSVTVWKDKEALTRFVRASPHREIMEEMRPRVLRSEFVQWRISNLDVPPDRREAEALLGRRLAVDRYRT